MSNAAIHDWFETIERLLATQCRHLKRAHVVAETDSTQDEAKRLAAIAGDVIVTGRQSAGRGRHGRAWLDGDGAGLAFTVVARSDPKMRLAAVFAVGVARGLDRVTKESVAIKWPNDLLLRDRKLAGILIEQDDELARVGIGINVGQAIFPAELAQSAVSLRRAGIASTRLEVLEAVLPAIDAAIGLDATLVEAAYRERDALAGRVLVAEAGGMRVEGEVIEVSPALGIRVRRTDTGEERVLEPATTSILSIEGLPT